MKTKLGPIVNDSNTKRLRQKLTPVLPNQKPNIGEQAHAENVLTLALKLIDDFSLQRSVTK